MRECIHCEITFDPDSWAKKQAGGKINECPDCVEELGTETAVKYLGLSSGDGKAAALGALNAVAGIRINGFDLADLLGVEVRHGVQQLKERYSF